MIGRGDWMQTATGRQFWPMDPRPHEVFIEDIAHALSMICRFTEIARMHISNIGGSRQVGHYHAKTYRGRSNEQLSRCQMQRQGTVKGYPRLKLHVWHLVARALIATGYAGAAELEQPTDLFDVINGAVPGERAP